MVEALINYARLAPQLTSPGAVYLIGAGPGDVELMTLKSVRILGEADVILIDSLVNPQVLQFAKATAEIIEVGKRARRKSASQADINSLLIDYARRGLRVVRLKGGDPCVFARGGEEMLALAEAGIAVTIVSGITSGIAAPAALQIPLTHRELAQSLVFAVGNSKPGGAEPNWRAIAQTDSTIVVYMGLTRARAIAAHLMAAGLAADTPAAAVQDGTLPSQVAILSGLKDLPDLIERQGLVSPTLLIIGKVVALSPLWQGGIGPANIGAGKVENNGPAAEVELGGVL